MCDLGMGEQWRPYDMSGMQTVLCKGLCCCGEKHGLVFLLIAGLLMEKGSMTVLNRIFAQFHL